jgi:hypothetical protein
MKDTFNKNVCSIMNVRVLTYGALLLFVLYPVCALAHPPRDLALSYNKSTQTLKVSITHESKSPDKHYIKKVEIIKNEAVFSASDYTKQPSPDSFSYSYKVPVAASDTIEVKATCSVFGSKQVKLTSGPSKELR